MTYSDFFPVVYKHGVGVKFFTVQEGQGYFINGLSMFGAVIESFTNDEILSLNDIMPIEYTVGPVTNPRVMYLNGYLFALEAGVVGATIGLDLKPEIDDLLTAMYQSVTYQDPSLIYSMLNRLSTASKNMLPENSNVITYKGSSVAELVPCSM